MGLNLCKDATEHDCLHAVGKYEELEEDSSAEKMGNFQKPELQISQQCSYDIFVAENEHEKLSIDVLRTDETEMKPECNSMPPPTDDVKLSITVSPTSCSIAKERLNFKNRDSFHDASGGWRDIANIRSSYVMPDLEEIPEKLLPVDRRERHTVPLINLNDLKRSKEYSLWTTTSPSLFRDEIKNEWNEGWVTSEVEAIKRQMERMEKESISKLSPKKRIVPNDIRYIKAESQDLVVVAGDEYKEVDDVNDSSPNSSDLDFIAQKTAEQMTDSNDSASTKYSEHSSGECLETGNIVHVQQS